MLDYFDIPIYEILWTIFGIAWIVVTVFWCLTMQRALETVAPECRKMAPANAWLTFIPLFGLVWQFVAVNAVGESLKEEFQRRSIITREPRPGSSSGLAANILACCAIIPLFGIVMGLISYIPRLIHLAKVKTYTMELEKIIHAQMNYVPPPPEVWQQPIANPNVEEQVQKSNPDRFKPPHNPEEDWERWRKK